MPPPAPPTHACRTAPAAITGNLRARATELWVNTHLGDGLDISFACDRLGPSVDELIFESSEGHSFHFNLYRLRRRVDGDYDLTLLQFGLSARAPKHSPPDAWEDASSASSSAATAVLPKRRVEHMLRRIRAAMHLELKAREAPPDKQGHRIALGTSLRFHVGYRISTSENEGLSGFWAGYQGSDGQSIWIPMLLMDEAFRTLIEAKDITSRITYRATTPEERAFFAERFATARERNDEYGYWYVKERLLSMARKQGGPALAPDVLSLAARQGEGSVARTRALAVDLLGQWSGVDVRYDAEGHPRPVDDVADDWVQACGKGSGSSPEPAPRL